MQEAADTKGLPWQTDWDWQQLVPGVATSERHREREGQPRGAGVELQRTARASWGWDRTAIWQLLLTSDLHTLSMCAETALPDGRYFHSKAENLEAQRGKSTCSVTQQT